MWKWSNIKWKKLDSQNDLGLDFLDLWVLWITASNEYSHDYDRKSSKMQNLTPLFPMCTLGHSLCDTNQISAVWEWLIRDLTLIKLFWLYDFFLSHTTWSKFKNFWNSEHRFWTIENHRFLANIHSKDIEIDYRSWNKQTKKISKKLIRPTKKSQLNVNSSQQCK